MKESCENCKFAIFEPQKPGYCRRNPPVIIPFNKEESKLGSLEVVSKFPRTYLDYWCGEYKAKGL